MIIVPAEIMDVLLPPAPTRSFRQRLSRSTLQA